MKKSVKDIIFKILVFIFRIGVEHIEKYLTDNKSHNSNESSSH